jgi:hypothetical protein
MIICSQVQPSSIMADDMPAMRPPEGEEFVTSTPLDRVVPMWRLSG